MHDALADLRELAAQLRAQARAVDRIAVTLENLLGDHGGTLAIIAQVIGDQAAAVERVTRSLDVLLIRLPDSPVVGGGSTSSEMARGS